MKFVNDFNDYSVLDCGDMMKIEKFGKYILKRPDPQAIWHMKNINNYKLNAIYHRSSSGGGEWQFFDLPKSWKISYDLLMSLKDVIKPGITTKEIDDYCYDFITTRGAKPAF